MRIILRIKPEYQTPSTSTIKLEGSSQVGDNRGGERRAKRQRKKNEEAEEEGRQESTCSRTNGQK